MLTACNPADCINANDYRSNRKSYINSPFQKLVQSIVLYRGNTQRTGVFDEPAIRQLPEIEWQTKISTIMVNATPDYR